MINYTLGLTSVLGLSFSIGNLFAASLKVDLENSSRDMSACSSGAHLFFEGDEITVTPHFEGSSRHKKFRYSWSVFGETPSEENQTKEASGSTFKVRVPKLQGDKDTATMVLTVSAVDSQGGIGSAVKAVQIARPYRLIRDPARRQCHRILPSEQISGIYTNDSSMSRIVTITDEEVITAAESEGFQKGFSYWFAPSFLGFSLGGFGWDKKYVETKTRSVERKTSFSVSTEILPQEGAVFFRQLTMIKAHYYVHEVDRCGNALQVGHGFYHTWVASYPVVLVDPFASNPLDNLYPGTRPLDSCEGFEESLVDEEDPGDVYYPIFE